MVSGHIKGKTGCVVCLEGTAYKYLRASTKLVYMHHRRFLNKTNRLQKMKHLFDSTEDHDTAPQPLKGTHVFEMVKNIQVTFGGEKKGPAPRKRKKTKGKSPPPPTMPNSPFKKMSIFSSTYPTGKTWIFAIPSTVCTCRRTSLIAHLDC